MNGVKPPVHDKNSDPLLALFVLVPLIGLLISIRRGQPLVGLALIVIGMMFVVVGPGTILDMLDGRRTTKPHPRQFREHFGYDDHTRRKNEMGQLTRRQLLSLTLRALLWLAVTRIGVGLLLWSIYATVSTGYGGFVLAGLLFGGGIAVFGGQHISMVVNDAHQGVQKVTGILTAVNYGAWFTDRWGVKRQRKRYRLEVCINGMEVMTLPLKEYLYNALQSQSGSRLYSVYYLDGSHQILSIAAQHQAE